MIEFLFVPNVLIADKYVDTATKLLGEDYKTQMYYRFNNKVLEELSFPIIDYYANEFKADYASLRINNERMNRFLYIADELVYDVDCMMGHMEEYFAEFDESPVCLMYRGSIIAHMESNESHSLITIPSKYMTDMRKYLRIFNTEGDYEGIMRSLIIDHVKSRIHSIENQSLMKELDDPNPYMNMIRYTGGVFVVIFLNLALADIPVIEWKINVRNTK